MSNLVWSTWDGGPHILLPEAALRFWEGGDPPSGGRIVTVRVRYGPSGPATDYDRACNVDDFIGVIDVGPHQGVVLDDEVPTSTLVRMPDSSLVAFVPMTWRDETSFSDAESIVSVLLSVRSEFAETGLSFTHPGGRVVLQPAVNGKDPFAERVWTDLERGVYDLLTADCVTDVGEFRAHLLRSRPAT